MKYGPVAGMRFPLIFAVRLVALLNVVGTATGVGHAETQLAELMSTISPETKFCPVMLKATLTFAAVGFGAIEMMTGRVRIGKFTGGVEARLSETLVTTMVAMPAVASKLCGTLTVMTVPLFEDGTSVADPAGAVKMTLAPVNCPESCRKLVPVIVSVVLLSPAMAPLGVTLVIVGVCGVNTVNGRAFDRKLPLCRVIGNVPRVLKLAAVSGA